MSRYPKNTSSATFSSLGASRGDGLHPLLLQALSKTGSVSGPPAPSLQSTDNIVRFCQETANPDEDRAPLQNTK